MFKKHSINLLTFAWLSLVGCCGCQSFTNNSEVIRVDTSTTTVCGTPQELTRQGVRALQQCKYELAETHFKQAIQLDETYAPAFNNLGRIYFQRGDTKRATEAFAFAMELMPGRPEPINNLGLVYESAGMLDNAIDYYVQAQQLAPDSPEYLANLLRARIRRGDRGDGIESDLLALRLIEHRPEWTAWVDDNLALLPHQFRESNSPQQLITRDSRQTQQSDSATVLESDHLNLASPENQFLRTPSSILFTD